MDLETELATILQEMWLLSNKFRHSEHQEHHYNCLFKTCCQPPKFDLTSSGRNKLHRFLTWNSIFSSHDPLVMIFFFKDVVASEPWHVLMAVRLNQLHTYVTGCSLLLLPWQQKNQRHHCSCCTSYCRDVCVTLQARKFSQVFFFFLQF